nr:short-chain dehydrogenase/reductase family 42E member 1 [Tanacetum cinerariifolium]
MGILNLQRGSPVNTFEFLRPLLKSLEYDMPKATIPVSTALFVGKVFSVIYTVIRNFNEKTPSTKVCKAHPLEFAGSTLLANLHAYIDSPTCIAMAQTASTLNANKDRIMKRHAGLSIGTGKNAAPITANIPKTQKNHS